jgi:hypothetical protein
MPRTSRLIISDEKSIYHVMSRTAVDGFPLKDVEKDFMLDLIKRFSNKPDQPIQVPHALFYGLRYHRVKGVCGRKLQKI